MRRFRRAKAEESARQDHADSRTERLARRRRPVRATAGPESAPTDRCRRKRTERYVRGAGPIKTVAPPRDAPASPRQICGRPDLATPRRAAEPTPPPSRSSTTTPRTTSPVRHDSPSAASPPHRRRDGAERWPALSLPGCLPATSSAAQRRRRRRAAVRVSPQAAA